MNAEGRRLFCTCRLNYLTFILMIKEKNGDLYVLIVEQERENCIVI